MNFTIVNYCGNRTKAVQCVIALVTKELILLINRLIDLLLPNVIKSNWTNTKLIFSCSQKKDCIIFKRVFHKMVTIAIQTISFSRFRQKSWWEHGLFIFRQRKVHVLFSGTSSFLLFQNVWKAAKKRKERLEKAFTCNNNTTVLFLMIEGPSFYLAAFWWNDWL